MVRLALSVSAVLMLAACGGARGYDAPHPHGYGHRYSPGRAEPTYLPLPGYDYRFRPDPQGIGRDLPPPHAYPPPAPPPCCEAEYGYYSDGYVRGGRTHEVYESRSGVEAYAYGEVYEDLPPIYDDYGPVPYESARPQYAPTPYSSGVIPYEPAPRQAPSETLFY